MCSCWELKPSNRPTFAELHQRLSAVFTRYSVVKKDELHEIVHEYEKFRLSQLVPITPMEDEEMYAENSTSYQFLNTNANIEERK